MKCISELIVMLESFKEEHGDIPVRGLTNCETIGCEVSMRKRFAIIDVGGNEYMIDDYEAHDEGEQSIPVCDIDFKEEG